MRLICFSRLISAAVKNDPSHNTSGDGGGMN
jgi:hypothetical protein